MALQYPTLYVSGSLEGGLIITAALPINLCPAQNRNQSLILTPAQSADLLRQIVALKATEPAREAAD